MLTYISLFSGIGGFDLGFDHAGMACQAQVEFNPKASAVLQHHWPNVKRFKDVRDVGRNNLPDVDIICGGFPCQDVSVAGDRAGLAGERSGLWFQYLRIIQELQPRWVVIENVPGLLSSNGGRDFAIIVQGLVYCGYCIAYRILDSQYFGTPQRRERLFIVASLGNGSAAQILFEPTCLSGNTQTFPPPPQTAAQNNGCDITGAGSQSIRSRISVYDARGNGRGAVVPTLVGSHLNRVTDYTPIIIDEENGARRLTPLECERLQSFPDNWTAVNNQSDSERYMQMGNAVTVNVAEWIAQRITAVEYAAVCGLRF